MYIRMHMYTHTYRVMPNPNPNVLFVVFISQRLKQHLPGIVAEIYQLMPPKINLTNATTFVTGLVWHAFTPAPFLFSQHLKQHLPGIVAEISQLTATTERNLALLGPAVPNDDIGKGSLVQTLVSVCIDI